MRGLSDFEKRIFTESGILILLAIALVVFDIRFRKDD